MANNGRLPDSELAAIPGGRLRKDAAASWLRLRARIAKETGVYISPTSTRTAYRPYADQEYFWNLYTSGRGALAARPGTSNHGWGVAVDLPTPAMQAAMRKYGPEYGWGIRGASLGSDAPSESWHALYHPDHDRHKGESVKPKRPDYAYLGPDEAAMRTKLMRLRRRARANGGWAKSPKLKRQADDVKRAMRQQNRKIADAAKRDGKGGWRKNHRRERYNAIRKVYYGR